MIVVASFAVALSLPARHTASTLVEAANGQSSPAVPRTWDDQAIAELEMALANPVGSPKHVSADYSRAVADRKRPFATLPKAGL
jgi:hypothetical protein